MNVFARAIFDELAERGMPQAGLAYLMDIAPQQIYRYGSTEYLGCSVRRLLEILEALELTVKVERGREE